MVKKLHVVKLEPSACFICGNCIGRNHPWYYCAIGSGNFGKIKRTDECEDYADLEEEEDDDDGGEFDPNETVECPICYGDAYWEGTCYECDNCGWCGNPSDK
ncbi:MAG: hypothetical protein L6V92_03085 [Phocaeicola vulgatus]|nr:MAG: hypothetical protein L6V92_03085 [Phocaeicola vulgatus]